MNIERDLPRRIAALVVDLDDHRSSVRRLLADISDELAEIHRSLAVLQRLAETQHEELVYWRTLAGVNSHIPYGGAYGTPGP